MALYWHRWYHSIHYLVSLFFSLFFHVVLLLIYDKYFFLHIFPPACIISGFLRSGSYIVPFSGMTRLYFTWFANVLFTRTGGCLYECEKKSTSILQQSDTNLSFNECQHYLRALYQVPSWVSFRNEPLSSVHNDLPPEMWGEIVSFLSNDFSSLLESFLVYDLRSGYIAPFAHTFCSARNAWLLSLLPYIEGHFRCDTWTMGRLLYITDWKPRSISILLIFCSEVIFYLSARAIPSTLQLFFCFFFELESWRNQFIVSSLFMFLLYPVEEKFIV